MQHNKTNHKLNVYLGPHVGNKDHEIIVEVDAPFFNDPPNPGGKPGEPFPQLWDY